MKRIFVIILPLLICLVPMLVWGETYYVSMGATGSWNADSWANAVNRSTPTSFTRANVNAVAGDTVIYINDGGIFINDGSAYAYIINPANNGTPGNPITFKGEDGTTVILDAENVASINLVDSSYINIENFTINNDSRSAMWIDSRNYTGGGTTHHITISDSSFESKRDYTAGFYFSGNNNHITIRNCTFDAKTGSVEGHYNAIYFVSGAGYTIEYILIEDSDVYGGNHGSIDFELGGGTMQYVVVRNNIIHNPNHSSLIFDGGGGGGAYFLVDNNLIYDAGSICGAASCEENVWGSSRDRENSRDLKHNLQWRASNGIVRKNLMYNGGKGMVIGGSSQNSMIYNNVMYKNCRGLELNTAGDAYNNVFKNNIMKDNDTNCNNTEHPLYVSLTGTYVTNEWMYNEFDDANTIRYGTTDDSSTQGNLIWLETNIPTIFNDNMDVGAGFVDAPNYNFNLTSNSSLIDKGGFLTYTIGSGNNSDTMIVDNARYFMDGWDLIEGDIIQLEGQSKTVRIINVNYSTNTITVDQNIYWYDHQGVSLAYNGKRPDIGVHESLYISVGLSPPTNIISK